MKCPECNSDNIKTYENNGIEGMCYDCKCMWQYFEDGTVFLL